MYGIGRWLDERILPDMDSFFAGRIFGTLKPRDCPIPWLLSMRGGTFSLVSSGLRLHFGQSPVRLIHLADYPRKTSIFDI